MKPLASALALFIAAMAVCANAAEPASLDSRLAAVPPNTWIKLTEESTGGRSSPVFFYEPSSKLFYLLAGAPGGTYAEAKRHFENETFDPRTLAWSNAYPPGAPWRNASGPTDAPAFGEDDAPKPLKLVGGIMRFATYGSAYGMDTRAHFQWAYDTDAGRLYAYLFNKTLRFNPAQRTWEDTGAAPFTAGRWPMVWGNMCYDPINREILSIGGSSEEPGGTPGTCTYSPATNRWTKLQPGSAQFRTLHSRATALRRQCWALLSACRSRFFITETESEAKANLASQAADLLTTIETLSKDLSSSGLQGPEVSAARRAVPILSDTAATLKSAAPTLTSPITAQSISQAKQIFDRLESVELTLAPEPPGRAHSQLAYDVRHHKIVLFGGNGLDRCYSDTWIYDCATRTWEQRYPALVPSPRAGHALVYLPQSGQIALAGGYTIDGSFKEIPHQLWTYDVSANQWTLLLNVPNKRDPAPRGGAGGNWAGGGSPWAGAATPDDVLVMVDTHNPGRSTWACKIDPSRAQSEIARKLGVAPGTMTFSRSPSEFEAATTPNPAEVQRFFATLPVNQWTKIPVPRPVDHRAWNTTAYDPDRHQFLWFGGGHVTYMATDVAHYSVRANAWTISYPPDLPTEPTGGFHVKAMLSFQDRPQVPLHAYQTYAYDPPSGRMLYLDRAYDVAQRHWEPQPIPGLQHSDVMHTLFETTPTGVVSLSEHGLFQFNAAQRQWKKLPWNGPAFGQAWCDGHALCYDSQRNCLWAAHKEIFRYDLATGAVDKLNVKVPKRLGEWALWREQVFIPDAGLVLLMNRFKSPAGRETNIAFDPETRQYYELDLNFTGGRPREISWSAALAYDPTLKTVFLHDGFSNIWALRLNRTTAHLTPIKD